MLSNLGIDDPDAIKGCLRDVVALSTLPAVWTGARPVRIAESLAAALFTTLDPDFVYVSIIGSKGRQIANIAQTDRYETDTALADRLGPELLAWSRTHDPEELLVLPHPRGTGTLRVATRGLGTGSELGVVATGFGAEGSPSRIHHLLLNIGASQATTAVTNALLLESLVESEERFRALVDASAQIVWTASAEGGLVEDSPSWRAFTGQSFAEMSGLGWLAAVHPEDREHTARMWSRAVRDLTNFEAEYRLRHVGGDWRWTAVRAIPRRDPAGGVREWVGMNVDVTDRKSAERTQRLLLDELNHRVKNTLANVQAIAQHTLRRAKDPSDFAQSFGGRIKALARVHTQLTEATWAGADLRALVRDQLLQVSPSDDRRIAITGPGVALTPQTALHMALVLHELGTNSSKYGALSTAEGQVAVAWAVTDELLEIEWRELGGPPVSIPKTRGFGTLLIQSSLKALGGNAQVTYLAEGVIWHLSFPLPSAQVAAERAGGLFARGASRHAVPGPHDGPDSGDDLLAGARILVVEDEVMVALSVLDMLEQFGAVPIGPAHSVEHALSIIDGANIDAALLDANLAGARVDEIAAALTRAGVPFAFVTGYKRESLPEPFQAAPVIAKPFSHAELTAGLRSLLARRRAGPSLLEARHGKRK